MIAPRFRVSGEVPSTGARIFGRCVLSAILLLLCTLTCTTAAEDQPARPGAPVPFVTIEAEAPGNSTNGITVRMRSPPTDNIITPELEASGRGYVELNATGKYLDIPQTPVANGLVIRHCIPDAPEGGGISATLSLYVNGVFRQKLPLTSKFNWLYGPVGQNGQSNDPKAGVPHVFWDETRAFITGGLKAGDTLRLQKDADDTAAFYRIDLVDLERVPTPLAPPAAGTSLSVADYGATGTGTADSTAAIQHCINDAKAQGKTVWMPAGTYYQSATFELNGVPVQGAGMWYTNLISTNAGTGFAGAVGFIFSGAGSSVSDLSVESAVHTSRGVPGGKPFTCRFPTCSAWKVSNVWITHTNVGFWMGGAKGGTIRGCRVRMTYADGINLNNGSSGNLVEMNHVRGTGDDGIALLSERGRSDVPSRDETVRANTVVAVWSGLNFDLAGGSGHIIEDNYLADNATQGCLGINLPGAWQMFPLTDAIIRRNLIVRGGGMIGRQRRGAIWIYPGSTTISGVIISGNEIVDSLFSAIQLTGSLQQEITFEDNTIENPGAQAVQIDPQVQGSGVFKGNICRRAKSAENTSLANGSGSYNAVSSNNSWH
jgi:hypothetical protein